METKICNCCGRELQLRAADNIYLTDRNGEVILSYRGVALYRVLDTKNETIIASPEYVSLDSEFRAALIDLHDNTTN